MNDASNILNFSSCLVIALASTVLLLILYDARKGEDRFVYRAFICWMLSWWVWVVLWGLSLTLPMTNVNDSIILLILSDVNTILLILFYLGLTRGRNYEPGRYVIHGFLFLAFNAGVLVCLYALVGLTQHGVDLHERWSLALGMFSPVLVGWAFKLRYQTDYVLLVGLTYAASQPLAYAALFGQVFEVPMKQAILACLAILKLVWAATASYYAGIRPLSTESLIRLPRHTVQEKPPPVWRRVLVLMFMIGAIAVIVIMIQHPMPMFGWIGAVMAGLVSFVTFLAALRQLGAVAHKWVRAAPPEDES